MSIARYLPKNRRTFQFATTNDRYGNYVVLTFFISAIDARLETPSIAYRSMSSESAILKLLGSQQKNLSNHVFDSL